MQAEVRKLELSAPALRALTPQRRYVFALASHVFDELQILTKWIHVSRRMPDSPGPQEDASVGLTMFLIRILIGKIHEAFDVLKKESVDTVLRTEFFGPVTGLEAKWEGALQQFGNLPWIGRVRNRGAFHYMTSGQWGPTLDDPTYCTGAYVWVGKRYADTYYHWSEMGAALPAMLEVNPREPFQGLEQIIADLGNLLGDLTDCLARGLQAFMNNANLCEVVSEPIRFDAPAFEPTALHYFFADERL